MHRAKLTAKPASSSTDQMRSPKVAPNAASAVASRIGRAVVMAMVLGTAACGVPPSEACERYLECQAHHDEILDRPATDTNIFQADGTCWENEDLADKCSDVCDARVLSIVERLERSELDLGPCG